MASAGLFVLTLIVMLFSTGVGESNISPQTVFAILTDFISGRTPFWTPGEEVIVMDIRLPRIVLGALIGTSLAISGVALQSLFRNPMADPYILGISNGAALGATIVFVYGSAWAFSFYTLPAMAFIFGLSTIFLVYRVAKVGNQIPVNTLLLSGIAIAALFSAVNSFIMFTGGQNLQQIMFWTMGGLSGRGWDYVWIMLPFTIAGVIIMLSLTRQLNAMMFGEESAQYLGIEVEKLKKILLITTALITSAAVSVSGIIGFVGLIIPHIVRLVTGPDHRILIPASIFAGAMFIVIADMFARIIIAPAELPLGVITALCGAPFFLYLLRSKRGEL
ncbi:MAG: iron chelate uptake ABC transporter family permease subunit [Methanomicrobiaceae archaeon]|nr:iron chelate uptake ABC transporter family permease subunit [Methanomicrobiaceae archaeon]